METSLIGIPHLLQTFSNQEFPSKMDAFQIADQMNLASTIVCRNQDFQDNRKI
jgi:hypothetical protein